MDSPENPYQAPSAPSANIDATPTRKPKPVPSRMAYAAIGFMFGTALIAPLVLSRNPLIKLIGGAGYGGSVGSLIGYSLGLRKDARGASPKR